MRYALLPLLLLFLLPPATIDAQQKLIRDFIQEHRRGDENATILVPGWLIGLTAKVGVLASEDEEERTLFRLASELGTVRVLTYLDADFAPHQQVENLLYSLENYHGYERWASVRTADGALLQLSVRYRKEKIDQLVVALREEDRTHFLSARADLEAEELGELLAQLDPE